MKKYLLLFLLSCFGMLPAQTSNIDSLLAVLPSMKEDTVRINLLNKISLELIWSNAYEQAVPYVREAGELSERLHYNKGTIAMYNEMGMISRQRGDNKNAIKNYIQAIELAQQAGQIGSVGSITSNLGRIYLNLGDYPRALDCKFKALKIHQYTGDKSKQANSYIGIGEVYLIQKNPKAEYCFFRALALYQEIKVYDGIAGAYNWIGKMYMEQGAETKALDYFYRSLKASEQADYATEKAISNDYIGLILQRQGKYKEALEHYKIALEIYTRHPNNEEISGVYEHLGNLYFIQGKYAMALEIYKNALETAELSGVLKRVKNAHEGLSETYTALNDPTNAFKHYKLFIETKEKIFNDDNTKKLVKAELDFEFEKKEQEIRFELEKMDEKNKADLRQEKLQRYFLVVCIFLLALAGIFLFQRFSLKQKLKVSKIRDKIASDLHDDVGAALSSISIYTGIAKMNEDEVLRQQMLEEIGKTSRETIENMSDIVWSIQPKNDQFIFILEKMRSFGQAILGPTETKFTFDYDEELKKTSLNIEQRKNFYLVYKEAINNAAKYSRADEVKVIISKNKNILSMQINDNGTGFNPKISHEGNGLNNIRTRALELDADLKISSSPGKGTEIKFSFKIS